MLTFRVDGFKKHSLFFFYIGDLTGISLDHNDQTLLSRIL